MNWRKRGVGRNGENENRSGLSRECRQKLARLLYAWLAGRNFEFPFRRNRGTRKWRQKEGGAEGASVHRVGNERTGRGLPLVLWNREVATSACETRLETACNELADSDSPISCGCPFCSPVSFRFFFPLSWLSDFHLAQSTILKPRSASNEKHRYRRN